MRSRSLGVLGSAYPTDSCPPPAVEPVVRPEFIEGAQDRQHASACIPVKHVRWRVEHPLIVIMPVIWPFLVARGVPVLVGVNVVHARGAARLLPCGRRLQLMLWVQTARSPHHPGLERRRRAPRALRRAAPLATRHRRPAPPGRSRPRHRRAQSVSRPGTPPAAGLLMAPAPCLE